MSKVTGRLIDSDPVSSDSLPKAPFPADGNTNDHCEGE